MCNARVWCSEPNSQPPGADLRRSLEQTLTAAVSPHLQTHSVREAEALFPRVAPFITSWDMGRDMYFEATSLDNHQQVWFHIPSIAIWSPVES